MAETFFDRMLGERCPAADPAGGQTNSAPNLGASGRTPRWALPLELELPEGKRMLESIEGIWKVLRSNPGFPPCLGGVAAMESLLQRLVQAANELQVTSCRNAAQWDLFRLPDLNHPPAFSLPYVLLRRLTMAVLHLLYGEEGGGDGAGSCQASVTKVCLWLSTSAHLQTHKPYKWCSKYTDFDVCRWPLPSWHHLLVL